jgi:dipeptidyl aminopeptidase/acylaminoacyl peptidase
MAAELKKHGVEHQLITLKGAEHGLAGGDKAEIDAAYSAALAFLKKHLTAERPK